jgi:hypothetical protein
VTAKSLRIFIGFDVREAAAFQVCRQSIRRFDRYIAVDGLILPALQARGLYRRPTERRLGRLWDCISGAPMATEFALSRFLVPELCRGVGWYSWALFMDSDTMWRVPPAELRALLDDDKAVMCVQHEHDPANAIKMDDQVQTSYPRKNWSSFLAFNCSHPANDTLALDFVNSVRGLDLHRLCWLDDSEIGALPAEWNYLVGHTSDVTDPKIVHWTDGGPWFPAFENAEFADEWREHLYRWAA